MKKIVFGLLLIFLLTLPIEDMLSVNPNLSMTRMLGQLVIGAWAVSVLATLRVRRIHPFYIAVLLFIAWNWLSFYWTIDGEATKIRTKTYLQLGLMSIMIWDLVDTKTKLRGVMQTYILGTLIAVGDTIYNFIIGQEAYLYSGGRFAATGFNANDLAIILALGLPIAWYLLLTLKADFIGKWFSVINILYLPLAIFAIILTGSRAGFLVTLVGLGYILLTSSRLGKWPKYSFVILAIGLIFAAIFIIPDATVNRVLSTFSLQDSSDLGGRMVIYEAAARVIDKYPLLGVGSGAFKNATSLNIIAHNSFLSVLSETGIIGFLFFTCMMVICGLEILRQPKMESYLWLTVFLIWGLGGSSVSWDFRKPTWLFFTLIIISAELFAEKKKEKQSSLVSQKIVRVEVPEQNMEKFPEHSNVH